MVTVTDMDQKLRHTSLVTFYFGTRVALDPTSSEAIENVSHRAYRDLSRTLHGIGSHPDKKVLLDDTHASLYQFITDLKNLTTQEEFNALHDSWCNKRIEFFKKHPHPDRKTFALTYGQAQKWINMTLKYLAVIDHPAIAPIYTFLHIPIDSIIYEEAKHSVTGIGVPRSPGNVSWSRLDQNQYQDYQQQLHDRITSADPSVAPLDWEAQAWVTRSSGTTKQPS